MKTLLLRLLSLLLLSASARAQSIVFKDTVTQFSAAQQPGSSLGRDFWFTPIEIPSASYYDLTIAAASTTTVFVQFPDSALKAIPVKQGTPSRFSIPLTWIMQTSDTIERKAIHVWCDSTDLSVALYCWIGKWYCQAAMNIPPTSSWDTDYVVATGPVEDNGSEFTITASEDSTVVTVIPSASVTRYLYPRAQPFRPKGTPFTARLNRGQSAQYQNNGTNDTSFSGTIVRSNKPVGIAAGSTGAGSYYPQAIRYAMMPPRRSWGRTYYSAPNGSSSVLFVASVNNQVIERYDQFQGWQVFCTLGKANDVFTQDIVDSGTRWVSNQPFLMANYQAPYSSGLAPIQFIPEPSEQFRRSVFFATPALRGDSYSAFDVNLIVNAQASSATLDGQDLLSLPASPLDATHNLYRAPIEPNWSPSQHVVQSDSVVDVYVTGGGGGGSNSFGYGTSNGVLAPQESDTVPPKIFLNQNVACVTVTIRDSASGLAGFISDSAVNFKVAWDPTFKIGQPTASVALCLTDSLKAASFSFTGYDIAGNGSRASISYQPNPRLFHPGMTVLAVQPDTCLVGTSKPFTITVTDTSLLAIRINKIASDNAAFIVDRDTAPAGRLPFLLLPGQPHTIALAFAPQDARLFAGHVQIAGPDISTQSVAVQGLGYVLASGVEQPIPTSGPWLSEDGRTLQIDGLTVGAPFRIQIENLLGQIVYSAGLTGSAVNIPMLATGVYIYRISSRGTGILPVTTTGKFIISR